MNASSGSGGPISIAVLLITTPLFLLQLVTLPIFLIYEDYRRNVCFRILFTNGITDCLILAVMHIFAIINLATYGQINLLTQRIGAAIMLQVFCLVVFQHLLLAINRLIVISRARFLGSKLICDEETEAKIFNMAHLLIWALYLLNVAAFLTPYFGGRFDPNKSSFYYDEQLPYTGVYHNVAFYLINIVPAICFLIYLCIIYMAIKSRSRVRSTLSDSDKLLSGQEQRLLIQATILYTVMSALIVEWKLDGGLPILWQFAVIEVPYLLFCGLNPILYFTMNREFRNRVLQLIKMKNRIGTT